jgi:hypothetical protein
MIAEDMIRVRKSSFAERMIMVKVVIQRLAQEILSRDTVNRVQTVKERVFYQTVQMM